MVRFNTVAIDNSASTVAVGAGLLWDDVYKLQSTRWNWVECRRRPHTWYWGSRPYPWWRWVFLSPVGHIYGCSIGAQKGYSWKTSQFGLVIDNIVSYELVLPDGTVRNVTFKDEDIFFALRVCTIVVPGF